MKIYLIDSDVLIDFFNKEQEAISLLKLLDKENNLAISVLSITELRSGWNQKEAEMYLPLLNNLGSIVHVSAKIAEQAGAYKYRYARKGISLPTIDVLIASTAILNSYCLVTRNKKDYPLLELEIYPL